ncbi:MAG TPA: hypothetical protein VHU84_15605 [Lacipirellulaceae bacterium]|nr:hypothetical protein [Lacipirellulaceae bacterium]
MSPEKQREFDAAWHDAELAARDVQNQWDREMSKDELLQATLDGYQRAEKADQVYCDAREKLRDRFGLNKFNELEGKFQPWILARGVPWLDSQDTKLLRVYAWYLQRLVSGGAPNECFWPGFDAKAFAKANESRRVGIIKSHLQVVRGSKSPQAQEMEREIDSIPLMRRYLERREEADGLHEICGEYLSQKGVGKSTEILAAEEKFVSLAQKAYDLWPGMAVALVKAHPERIPDELKAEFEEQLNEEESQSK